MASEAYAAIYASLPFHKKVRTIPAADRLAAFGYYVAVCVYCQTYRTDGFVAHEQLVAVFPCTEEERTGYTSILVRVGLFDEVEDGVEVHGYLSVNKSREQIEAAHDRMSEGGRKGGRKAGRNRPSLPLNPTPEGSIEESRAEVAVKRSAEQRRDVAGAARNAPDPACALCEGSGVYKGEPCWCTA
jgi:hypothetical protein